MASRTVFRTRMTVRGFDELWMHEVDTIGSDSPRGKRLLAEDMQRTRQRMTPRMQLVTLTLTTRTALAYLNDAIPYLYDMAEDQLSAAYDLADIGQAAGWMRTLKRLMKETTTALDAIS